MRGLFSLLMGCGGSLSGVDEMHAAIAGAPGVTAPERSVGEHVIELELDEGGWAAWDALWLFARG